MTLNFLQNKTLLSLLAIASFGLASCSSVYYGAMEKVGIPKREIMASRVEKARDTQEETKEEFKTALEQFSELTGFSGGELEATYKRLDDVYTSCEAQASEVGRRNDAVENVSEALFKEWESELGEYENPRYRRQSELQLQDARRRYGSLIQAMRRAESRIDPVLKAFRDQVLYLKHNLNAQAVASLRSEVAKIELDVSVLIREMESAIAEADAFIETLQ